MPKDELLDGINTLVEESSHEFSTGTLTKRNYAGYQQPYVPAGHGDESGEYRDNAYGGGSSFEEESRPIEKPLKEKKEKEIGIEIESKKDTKKDISSIKNNYEGKGKQLLADELKQRLGRSSNLKKLLEDISGADDEYSGVIADYYKSNPDIQLKVGKNLSSKYQITTTFNRWTGDYSVDREIRLGQGFLTSHDYYSNGGVFFHESGHALDDTFMDESNHRANWSIKYKSEKYEKTLHQMIQEEIREHFTDEGFNQLKAEVEEYRKNVEKNAFTPEMEQELNKIKEIDKEAYTALMNDEEHKSLIARNNEILNDIVLARKAYNQNPTNENLNAFQESQKKFHENDLLVIKHRDDFYAKNYPNLEAMKTRKTELQQKKWDISVVSSTAVCRKYADISDMIEGSTYKSLTGAGHGFNYWYGRNQQGKEAFAEIMSAKATNPESYEVLKRYCPKSIEIFDEIIAKIRGGK